jgi:hypothetical protein
LIPIRRIDIRLLTQIGRDAGRLGRGGNCRSAKKRNTRPEQEALLSATAIYDCSAYGQIDWLASAPRIAGPARIRRFDFRS